MALPPTHPTQPLSSNGTGGAYPASRDECSVAFGVHQTSVHELLWFVV